MGEGVRIRRQAEGHWRQENLYSMSKATGDRKGRILPDHRTSSKHTRRIHGDSGFRRYITDPEGITKGKV